MRAPLPQHFHRARIPWRDLRCLMVLAAAAACASCANPSSGRIPAVDRPATADEVARWRAEHGFSAASEEETTEAARWEKRFVQQRAVSPDGRLRVVLRTGERVGDFRHGFSTTSVYQLMDASGRVLLTAPGRVHRPRPSGEAEIETTLLAWFPPGGSKVLVHEDLHECNGPPPLAILFYQDPENQNAWSVRFPDVTDLLNQPYDEGNHAECRGLLGDQILIRNTSDGVSKIRLDRLKDRHPFPFTIG